MEQGPGAYPEENPIHRILSGSIFTKTMVMGAAIHEAGGERMGSAPDNSVLDSWNRSWDIPNLLLTDASAFPTSGIAGTTLTIMALTVRACRKLGGRYGTNQALSDANVFGVVIAGFGPAMTKNELVFVLRYSVRRDLIQHG